VGTLHSAVVLGLFDTGVGVASLLRLRGISVVGVSHSSSEVGSVSARYRFVKVPDPVLNPQDALDAILKISDGERVPPVLFPTSDMWVGFVSRFQEELRGRFLFNVPRAHVSEVFLEKKSQLEFAESCGIRVPRTVVLDNFSSDEIWNHELRFPVFVKGKDSPSWQRRFSVKGFVTRNIAELKDVLSKTVGSGISVVCQEIVPGAITNNIEVNAYVSAGGALSPLFCVRKIRQFPPRFGAGSMLESTSHKAIEKVAEDFIMRSGIRGFANIEFKIDPRDNLPTYIETNIRPWQQVEMAAEAGCDFVWVQYCDLTREGVRFDEFSPNRVVRWIDPLLDFQSFLLQPEFQWKNLKHWASMALKVDVWSVFSNGGIVLSLRKLRWGRQFLSLGKTVIRRVLFSNLHENAG
jgi:predicted ATP-grasp superfamily ATP-dependent carboligase